MTTTTTTTTTTRKATTTTVGTANLLGWVSDTFAIDFVAGDRSPAADNKQPANGRLPPVGDTVHTLLVFVPGNPGLMEWYLPFFAEILEQLGPGYACRGVANASHSLDRHKVQVHETDDDNAKQQRHAAIPWTVDGQALHKCAFVDQVVWPACGHRWRSEVELMFVSHSIGCHFTQRMLVWRPDILHRTRMLLHLMPFVRMDAVPQSKARLLDFCAARPEQVIAVHQAAMRGLAALPLSWVDALLRNTMDDKEGRAIAAQLVRLPDFARNFFTLGCEEIRDVPQVFDVCALRYIGRSCPTAMLFAGNDHWAPLFHRDDLQRLQSNGTLPRNIVTTYEPSLQHDFVSASQQVPTVVQYCVNAIRRQQHHANDGPEDSSLSQSPPLLQSRL